MANTPVGSRNVGLQNETLVLSLLIEHGKLSQAQLCQLAGFSSSTVSYVVGRLREKGLILEQPGTSAKRGAKPTICTINPNGHHAVGVEISPSSIVVGLFDFLCRPVEIVNAPIDSDHRPEAIIDAMEINLRGLLAKHGLQSKTLLGIGATLSGSISRDGLVELSSPLGWKNVPLGKMLKDRFAAPVTVHSTRVCLLAEKSVTPALASKNVLYLHVGNGVGGHMIIDGRLVHGATTRSGELGHIVVDPEGPLCGCGHKGCLEALVSGPALARKIRQDIANGAQTTLSQTLSPDDLPEAVVAHWGAALAADDPYALAIRDHLTGAICQVMPLAVNLCDPDTIILAGYVAEKCLDFLAQRLRQRMEKDVYDYAARPIKIMAARAGPDALICGVATAILQNSMQIS